MTSAPSGERPTASLFYDPVVYLIGKHAKWRPYVGVDHEVIRDDAIRLAGLTATKQGRDACSRKRDGLYRRVHFAWRNQRNGYCGMRAALCAKPMSGERGQWALTREGVKHAKALREVYEGRIRLSSGPNETSLFLAKNFETLYGRLTLHLRRKMPKSDSLDKVEDHAMNWLERVIARDGLRKRLVEKRPPAPSQMCAWVRRSAYSDIRNEGREPVCRLLHGALTKSEFGLYDVSNWTTTVIPRTLNDTEGFTGSRHAEHSEDDASVGDMTDHLTDLSDMEKAFAGSDEFDMILGRVASILHDEISDPTDVDWYLGVVTDRFVHDLTVREIAEKRGMTYEDGRGKIKNALDRVRTLALQARAEGDFDDMLTP